MTGYTKLFGSIIASTIWREDDKTRLVWITMLALKNRMQIVEASIPGLADFAKVSIQDCEAALKKLSEPDKYSRSEEFEGRRIEKIDGGWLILNGEKYRSKMGADERREANRIYQQRHRSKISVSKRADESDKSAMSAQAESEAESEAEKGSALTQAENAGIPADFADYVYADWSGRGGKDGGGVAVKWPHYVAKRWAREQVEWENGHHKGNKNAKQSVKRITL